MISLVAGVSLISGLPALVAASSDASSTPTNVPPVNVSSPAKSQPGAASNNPKPPPPPQTVFNRYGNILQSGGEPAHPLRLTMPLTDIGEIKVPTQDELLMREKLEQLATLSDDQIRNQLLKWPPFAKMCLRDEGMMLARIQDFRDHREKLALQEAHDLGLVNLTPDQQARFEKEYWNKRLPMERDLATQFQLLLKQRQAQLSEELCREFSSNHASPPPKNPPPSPAKPTSPPADDKPSPPASPQTAQAGTSPADGRKASP
ncbi:MAG TPA: hypothetical protein VL981_01700 [Candidatus Methylacidiphilales bacterium]|nr:hypothetical protein [Candidatus Methylacidiphilales bacterium]